jgi:hypothetical protein
MPAAGGLAPGPPEPGLAEVQELDTGKQRICGQGTGIKQP